MAKPRILISSDIGGSDPDDIQSMVHALLYADEFKLEGLVSTPTKHGGRTSDIHKVIDAYEADYSKLKTWSSDYPSPDYLRSITKQGNINVAPSKGWSTPTEGSKAIIDAAHASSEPLWVLTWGAMTDVAQALHDDPSIKSKIKLYAIGGWNTQQDPNARDYIYNNHKDLWFIENDSSLRGMYVDANGNATNGWRMDDAKGHGALGEHYYKAMPWGLKMGDTPSLLYLLDHADDSNPGASSWGGKFVKTGHGPNYWTDSTDPSLRLGSYDGARTTHEYQDAFYKDFVNRLDRAKASNPNAGSDTGSDPAPAPAPSPAPGTGGSSTVVAVDDDMWKTGVNETMWQNARYLTSNDKGSGTLQVTSVAGESAAGGTVSFNSDGTIKFTPKAGWSGKDWVEYTVRDGNGVTDTAKFYIQVGSGTATPGSPPQDDSSSDSGGGSSGNPVTAVDDNMWKTGANETMWQNARYLTWNDKGADGGLKVTEVASKSAAGGSVSFASDGTIRFTPKAGWQGKDWVEYTVADADGSTDTGKFYVQVGSGTATPSLPPQGDSGSGGTGSPVTAVVDDFWKIGVNETMWQNARYLTWNDKGADGGLKVTEVASKSAAGGSISFDSDGTIKYKPVAGWQGKDAVQYTVADADGSSDTGTFYVQVGSGGPVMQPSEDGSSPTPSTGSGNPVDAYNDHWNAEGDRLYFNSRYLLANDKAPDGGLAVKSIATTTTQGGKVNWDADSGTTIYYPKAGFTGRDYVEYTAVDRDGSTDTALVQFDVLLA